MLMTVLPDSAHPVLTIPTCDLRIEAVEFSASTVDVTVTGSATMPGD